MSVEMDAIRELRRLQSEVNEARFQVGLLKYALHVSNERYRRAVKEQGEEKPRDRYGQHSTRESPTIPWLARGGYDPAQPRVPRGHPDGGQWTRLDYGGASDGQVLSDATPDNDWGPGERHASILSKLRKWLTTGPRAKTDYELLREANPSLLQLILPNNPKELEREIAAIEEASKKVARRFVESERLKLRHNGDQPLVNPTRFDGRPWIQHYRDEFNFRDLFKARAWENDEDTVAMTVFKGIPLFGINSKAPGYEAADYRTAVKLRDEMLKHYSDVMATRNTGHHPNTSVFHAESTVLLRAAKLNRGTLAGETLEVQVDEKLCPSCLKLLPSFGKAIGNPTVTFVDINTGMRKTMKDGDWLP